MPWRKAGQPKEYYCTLSSPQVPLVILCFKMLTSKQVIPRLLQEGWTLKLWLLGTKIISCSQSCTGKHVIPNHRSRKWSGHKTVVIDCLVWAQKKTRCILVPAHSKITEQEEEHRTGFLFHCMPPFCISSSRCCHLLISSSGLKFEWRDLQHKLSRVKIPSLAL